MIQLKNGLDSQGAAFDTEAWVRDWERQFGATGPQFSMPQVDWSQTPSKIVEMLTVVVGALRSLLGWEGAYP
jgi:hypothetical protein